MIAVPGIKSGTPGSDQPGEVVERRGSGIGYLGLADGCRGGYGGPRQQQQQRSGPSYGALPPEASRVAISTNRTCQVSPSVLVEYTGSHPPAVTRRYAFRKVSGAPPGASVPSLCIRRTQRPPSSDGSDSNGEGEGPCRPWSTHDHRVIGAAGPGGRTSEGGECIKPGRRCGEFQRNLRASGWARELAGRTGPALFPPWRARDHPGPGAAFLAAWSVHGRLDSAHRVTPARRPPVASRSAPHPPRRARRLGPGGSPWY